MHRLTRFIAALILICTVLAGCAGDVAFKKGEKYDVEGDLDRAVAFYRDALQHDPNNITYMTRLTRVQEEAAIRHMDRAGHYLKEKNPDAAIYEAEQANIYSPGNDKARQLIEKAQILKKVENAITIGKSYLAAGRPNEALNEFYKVLDLDPKNKIAKKYSQEITKRKVQESEEDELSLASKEPITLSFKDAKLKEVFEFLSKISGISILFDEDVKNQPVTVFAKDVSFKEALNLLLATNKLFMKKIASDAIIIIPKTKAKEDQYQDLKIKTFYLSHIQAKDMVNILRTMLETRRIIINDTLNSITLRETPEKLQLAEKLIEANDRQDSEVIIDCDVMSVDRGPNTTTYGISWPTSVTGTYVPPALGMVPSVSSGSSSITPTTTSSLPTSIVSNITNLVTNNGKTANNIWLKYPTATATLSETFGKAETLTNPQIRA
ncbi:MAG: secretin N-terminal domain-containing protein, partial [Nitrospirota bacterium]